MKGVSETFSGFESGLSEPVLLGSAIYSGIHEGLLRLVPHVFTTRDLAVLDVSRGNSSEN